MGWTRHTRSWRRKGVRGGRSGGGEKKLTLPFLGRPARRTADNMWGRENLPAQRGRPRPHGRPRRADQEPPSYLNESSSLIRYVSDLPASICTSCSITRAMRRSRNVREASSMAAAVAFSQDSSLVPTSVTTLYTLSSAMKFSLRASSLAVESVTAVLAHDAQIAPSHCGPTRWRHCPPFSLGVARAHVLVHAVVLRASNSASSRLSTLPVAVIGRASQNSMWRGYLYCALCCLHQALISSAVTVAPGFRMIKALTS